MRPRPFVLLCALLAVVVGIGWLALATARQFHMSRETASSAPPVTGAALAAQPADDPTDIYAHNLLLQQGPSLRVYIPWLRGQLVRRHASVAPSLDLPDSFALSVDRGVLRLQMQDLSRFLNSGTIQNAPFSHVSFDEKSGLLVMHATVRELKVVPLPVELTGVLTAVGGNRIAFKVQKIHVLKMPLGGLLHTLDLKIGDVFQSHAPGIVVTGNTVYFNADVLPPPPHIVGQITSVHLIHDTQGLAMEAIYNNAGDDPQKEEQWRDFLRLQGGTLSFGKLTMRHVDLILIDQNAKDPFFDLDLAHYQTQLVHGITRATPQAGLQIFMPSLDQLPNSEPSATITSEWLKDRDLPAPPAVPSH